MDLDEIMFDLYNDYDWALAASLGDMEFEQNMYDDIMYGDPFISNVPTGYKDTFNMENMPFNPLDIFPQYDYDKFAMKGLRKHAKEGLGRYFGENITGGPLTPSSATWHPGNIFGRPAVIDFEIPQMFSNTDEGNKFMREMLTRHHPPLYKHEWPYNTYQDTISDTARHEYKHGVVDNEHPYSHPAIYGTGAQYDIGSVGATSDMGAFHRPDLYNEPIENYNPDIAGDVVRDIVERPEPSVGQPNPHGGW
jgi:hypothetical protein